MKRLNLVLVMLLCTPLLFATNIDDLFKKWKKDYPTSTTEKWEEHKVTAQDNAQIAQNINMEGVKGEHVIVFETRSSEVVSALKADLEKVTAPHKFEVMFSKTYANGIQVYLVGRKDKEVWREAYGVFIEGPKNKAAAFQVKGELPNEIYEGLTAMATLMLDQFAAGQMK